MKCTNCGHSISGLEGNLVWLSPATLDKVYNSELYRSLKQSTDKKHIVLCMDCVRKAMANEPFSLGWFGFKNGYWYTINLQCIAKMKGISPMAVIKSPLCSKCVSRVKKSQARTFLNSIQHDINV